MNCIKCGEPNTASGICRPCFRDYSDTIAYDKIGEGPYHIGAEVEMECPEEAFQTAVQKINRHKLFYTKPDGSLPEFGIEMVSVPMSVRAWYENYAVVDDLFFRLTSLGCKSWETTTCGLHFHVSREAIDDGFHYYKLLKLFSDEEFVLKVTGRDPSRLRRWASCPSPDLIESEAEEWESPSYNRYTLLRRTRNTLEFRGFRGTLSVQGFFGGLELYRGAIEFTRTSDKEEVNIENFKTFINAHRLRYAGKKLCV